MSFSDSAAALTRAVSLIQTGNVPAARAVLEECLARGQADGESRRLLAKIRFAQGELAAALPLMAGVAAEAMAEADFEHGVMLLAAGDDQAAEAAFRRELARAPGHAGARYNLAIAHESQGRADDTAAAYAPAAEAAADNFDAWYNLGNVLARLDRHAESEPAYQRARALRPDDPRPAHNLALALLRLGRPRDAAALLAPLVAAQTDNAGLHAALGNALSLLGEHDRAVAHLRQAALLAPGEAEHAVNLGLALRLAGRLDEARQVLLPWRERAPSAALLNALALVLNDAKQLHAAVEVLEQALARWPDDVEIRNNLGNLYSELGRLDDAIAHYRAAHHLAPAQAAIHSNLLFALTHSTQPAAEILAEHVRFGTLQEALAAPLPLPPPAPRAGRRLKVGLLSPDLRDHAVLYFLRPVLEQLEHGPLDIHYYPCGRRRDARTAELRAGARHWRDLSLLPPQRAAQAIRDDGIDILIDLAGHSAENGLPIMAWKPAPLQATWLGYPNTTGMTRVDYRLGEGDDPPGTIEPGSTERCVRLLDHPVLAPPNVQVALAPPPEIAAGHLTLACLNKFAKVSDQCLEAWGRLLARVPQARLLIVIDEGEDGLSRAGIASRLEQAGIAPARVEIVAKRPLADFLALLNRIDIALDPFPYGGGSTTFFTLWMGVPVVTLTRSSQRSMTTAATLAALDLHDLATRDIGSYVVVAEQLAHDLGRRLNLRATLRARLLSSPIMRPHALARRLEQVLCQLWDHHVNSRGGAP